MVNPRLLEAMLAPRPHTEGEVSGKGAHLGHIFLSALMLGGLAAAAMKTDRIAQDARIRGLIAHAEALAQTPAPKTNAERVGEGHGIR